MGTGDRPLAMANLRTFGLRVVLNRTNYVFPEEAAFDDLYRGTQHDVTNEEEIEVADVLGGSIPSGWVPRSGRLLDPPNGHREPGRLAGYSFLLLHVCFQPR